MKQTRNKLTEIQPNNKSIEHRKQIYSYLVKLYHTKWEYLKYVFKTIENFSTKNCLIDNNMNHNKYIIS